MWPNIWRDNWRGLDVMSFWMTCQGQSHPYFLNSVLGLHRTHIDASRQLCSRPYTLPLLAKCSDFSSFCSFLGFALLCNLRRDSVSISDTVWGHNDVILGLVEEAAAETNATLYTVYTKIIPNTSTVGRQLGPYLQLPASKQLYRASGGCKAYSVSDAGK